MGNRILGCISHSNSAQQLVTRLDFCSAGFCRKLLCLGVGPWDKSSNEVATRAEVSLLLKPLLSKTSLCYKVSRVRSSAQTTTSVNS